MKNFSGTEPDSHKNPRPSIKFDAMMFIILAVLGYLLSYRLTSYLADFKVEKHYSRIDIVFLAVCALIMYLPMSHISDAKKSDTENRNLAVWKPLIKKDGQLNFNFGRDYDKWFSDRFNMRNFLFTLAANINKKQPNVIVGKEDWLFYTRANGVRNFLNIDLFTSEELQSITNYLVSVDEYCRKKNKKFYFIICPDKNKIYGEYYPDYVKQNISNDNSRAMQLVNHLREHTNVKVIYPYDELIDAKKEGKLLYWKKDTHWNSLGAYVGYKAFMNQLIKDGVNINVVSVENYIKSENVIKDLEGMFIGKYKNVTTEPEYFEPFITKNYEYIEGAIPDGIVSHRTISTRSCINAPKVAMFRDSFTIAMLPFIANTFSEVDFYWFYDVRKNLIENADIVVLEAVERLVPDIVSLKLKNR